MLAAVGTCRKERVLSGTPTRQAKPWGRLPCIQQADALRSTHSWDLGCTWMGEP